MNTMVTAVTYGDRSVGIEPVEIDLVIHGLNPQDCDDQDRTTIKEMLGGIASYLSGGDPVALSWFCDECPDCGAKRKGGNGKCSREYCISNAP